MLNKRDLLIEVFNDTETRMKEGQLKEAVDYTIKNTDVFTEKRDVEKRDDAEPCKVTVTKNKTFQAAFELRKKYPDERICVHNFASATNPGGGVKRGSTAQEECLCRSSTLYPCLDTKMLWDSYYGFHRKLHDLRYTDKCIYTPDIVVFKDDSEVPKLLKEEDWIHVDVITCAAPNLREKPYNAMNPGEGTSIKVTDRELLEIHKKRAHVILSAAVSKQVDVLVLGAFGCGAFCNNPEIVARAYREVIPEYRTCFREIEFAVYCTPRDMTNFYVFSRVLRGI